MSDLPKRTADTMSDAIALSSPNGKMSKRARDAASKRLARALFGENCTREDITGRDERPEREKKRESLLRTASMLRGLAEKGMHPRKYRKEADCLEAEAKALETASVVGQCDECRAINFHEPTCSKRK